jgi:putative hemolysin
MEKIDIRAVFKSKNSKAYRFIPGFVFRYLHRILHIDFINYFLEKHGEKTGLPFLDAVIEEFNIKLEVRGIENLPDTGRFVFAGNHPLGGFDGIIMIALIRRKYGCVKSISNDILMNITNINEFFIPINKHGSQKAETATQLNRLFRSDCQILTFPSGLVSRRTHGTIRDTEWKKSFISKSRQYARDIVPFHVSGRCSGFFYRLANLRKFLKIKTNLEMFFLPDETIKHRNEHIIITFGKPIPCSTFDKRHTDAEWAGLLQDFVYKLPSGNEMSFSIVH